VNMDSGEKASQGRFGFVLGMNQSMGGGEEGLIVFEEEEGGV
jgi:hypothetical protein